MKYRSTSPACHANTNTFTTTRGYNGAGNNENAGNRKTFVTHKPRADISHRRQQSLADRRKRGRGRGGGGDRLSAPSNEVDAKYVEIVVSLPCTGKRDLTYRRRRESPRTTPAGTGTHCPHPPPPSPQAKLCSLIRIRCKDGGMGVSQIQMLAHTTPTPPLMNMTFG